MGIAAFCLIAVFGLVPVGVQTNRNATSQTAATNILSSVVSDIRASPPGQARHLRNTKLTGLNAAATTVCFDGQGQSMTLSAAGTTCPAIIIAIDFMYKSQLNLPAGGVPELCLAESELACCSQSPHDNAQWLGGNGHRFFC